MLCIHSDYILYNLYLWTFFLDWLCLLLHLHFLSVVLPVISILIHNITSIILISGTYCHYCDLTWEDLIVTAHIISGGFTRQKSQHSASKV